MKCEIVTGNMPQLWEDLLSQLHEKEYPSESIRHYREAMGRVDRYMRENQILEYTEAVGETYLATHGGRISSGRQFYMSFYVRRLNDILNKRPYVVVHTRKKQKDLKHFSGVFERFDEMLCKQSISDGTRKLQDLYCYEFLHFVEQQGISDLKEINAQILYAAFSASGSKENFRCAVRKLMKYLYQEQIHPLNLAEFVPAVRRAKPMPTVYTHDISEFTEWLVDAVKLTIEAVRNGTYNESVARLLPYKHRTGVITRAGLWKLYPEEKESFFEALTQEDVDEFLATGTEDCTGLPELKEMTANDFYRFCALGYAANNYDGQAFAPKAQYYRHADGRDDGLKKIDPDSAEAFADWLENREKGGHPWEVCRGGNSTHVSLYVGLGRVAEGCYHLALAAKSYGRCVEAIKFYLALKHAGLPVIIYGAEFIKKRLLGLERVGIVPNEVMPFYCHSRFPGEDVDSFRHLNHENPDAEIALIEWQPIKPVKLKENAHE